MAEDKTVLIAAICGRALAQSARRAGFVPLVADFFGDEDTRAAAGAHLRLAGHFGEGIQAEDLLASLASLARGRQVEGIVCGTGFEDRPHLLAAIAQRFRLIGNGSATVARIKDPFAFARDCRALGIAHPDVSPDAPDQLGGWLRKRRGGAGGSHVRPAGAGRGGAPNVNEEFAGRAFYFQRRVEGMPVSAAFLADGTRASLLGFSQQWAEPAHGQPFRFGGAVTCADVAPEIARAVSEALGRLVARTGLVGLNSADFLVAGEEWHLLEINPRPGATLDIFEPAGDPLFALHVRACAGALPACSPAAAEARAMAIVYAAHHIAAVPALAWPDWCADRPAAGGAIAAGAPVCTVLAAGADAAEARNLVEERRQRMLSLVSARAA
jgi:predicted ATP-grasp superfamily ATP-dependent carboligase